MQMRPDETSISPCFQLGENEDGEPLAVFLAHPPGKQQVALAFGLPEFRALLANGYNVLLHMRAMLAPYFGGRSTTTGDLMHVISAAAMDEEHDKGHRLPAAALCGARPKRGEKWDLEPIDAGQQPCSDCTCPKCQYEFSAATAGQEQQT